MFEIPETLSFEVNTDLASFPSFEACFVNFLSPRGSVYSSSPNKETPLTTGQLDQSGQRYAKLIRPIYKRRSTLIDHHRNFYDTQPANYKNELSSMEQEPTRCSTCSTSISIRWIWPHPIDDRIVSNLSNRGR